MVFLGGADFSASALHFLVMAPLLPLRFLNNGYGMGAAMPTLLTEMLTEMLTEILPAPHAHAADRRDWSWRAGIWSGWAVDRGLAPWGPA